MRLALDGLQIAPAQVWGSVRLIPLIRAQPIPDLRMALRDYAGGGAREEQVLAVATLGHNEGAYLSYIPHGLVVRWGAEGQPIAPVDTRTGSRDSRRPATIVQLKGMSRREGRHGLRLLPLHLAMEGFLALHFGGPDVAHTIWTRTALRDGLDPRAEASVRGAALPGLAEALRVFEVHPGQCGVLVFVGDGLASALVVSHPDDYLSLHDALIQDFYGELLYHWGWSNRDVPAFGVCLDEEGISSLSDVRAALERGRRAWAVHAEGLASGLFGRGVDAQTVRRAGRFRLVRFFTGFSERQVTLDGEHLGEALVDADGRLAYLKTYRLDRGQVRRGHVLSQLAAAEWDPRRLAAAQGHGELRRVLRDIDAAGLGWMVRTDWRIAVQRGRG